MMVERGEQIAGDNKCNLQQLGPYAHYSSDGAASPAKALGSHKLNSESSEVLMSDARDG